MDEKLYDEFGNYIGPALEAEEEVEDEEERLPPPDSRYSSMEMVEASQGKASLLLS